MATPKLTDIKIKKAKPTEKDYKLFDGGGLFLLVKKKGSKIWHHKFRFEGKEKLLSLGKYPDVGLREAREKHSEARRLLASGINPSNHRKAEKEAVRVKNENSFELVAREWFNKKKIKWKESHSKTIIRRLESDIFPYLGDRPIAEVSAQDVLQVLQKVEGRGAIETAHREKGICSQVFCYAVSTGRIEHDPTSGLRGALSPVKTKHMAAITKPKRVGELMRMIEGYQGTLVVQCALKINPLVFVRPGELRKALWKDINWEKKQWEFISSKKDSDLIVPLSTQALSILHELQPLTGHGEYIFPCTRSQERPMSENAILAALRRMGVPKEEMVGHGFRATARTLLDEELGCSVAWIELQLAHDVRDPLGGSYNRTSFLPQRREMMQKWADYLDELKAGS